MNGSIADWRILYRIADVAAFILLVYSLLTMVILVVLGAAPGTAQEGFSLLQSNRLLGLLRLDMLTILVMPMYFLLFLGFYGALQKTNPALVLLSASLGFVGVTLVLATPSALSFLALSDKYAASSNSAEKNLLLAAGEAILASDLWHGSGAVLGGLLLQCAALLVSVLMLRSDHFARSTAWVGVLTHGLDLLRMLVGFVLPAASVAFMVVAGPLYLLWLPLLGRDFFRLGKENLP